MSEHNIKELTRQRDSAKSAFNQANINLMAAEKRLHDALTAETGLVGKVAVTKRNKFLVQSIEFISGKPLWIRGFKLKNDGTPGFQEVGDDYSSCSFESFSSKAQ